MKISKSILGVTGEYYVAAELGKRNIYAQLTMGNQKRVDLLVFSEESSTVLKIEVKNKQGIEWPNCKGIYQEDSFLVFVDFKDIGEVQRPDFYILSERDWYKLIKGKEAEYKKKHPGKRTEIINNVLILIDERNKNGKSYEGWGIKTSDVEMFKEDWSKILRALE